jgi:hypothetical protein
MMETSNYTTQYVAFCQKAGLPINEVPEPGKKMDLAYEMAMKEVDPYLYQNLTSPKSSTLKADVRDRYERGVMWTQDLEEYQKKGFTGTARNIEIEMNKAREMMEQQKLKEMTARNDAREKAIREKPPGFQGLAPLSPESIARARAEWGITGN